MVSGWFGSSVQPEPPGISVSVGIRVFGAGDPEVSLPATVCAKLTAMSRTGWTVAVSLYDGLNLMKKK
jgi:hypothetical protein